MQNSFLETFYAKHFIVLINIFCNQSHNDQILMKTKYNLYEYFPSKILNIYKSQYYE